jgi:hypothetical protein
MGLEDMSGHPELELNFDLLIEGNEAGWFDLYHYCITVLII